MQLAHLHVPQRRVNEWKWLIKVDIANVYSWIYEHDKRAECWGITRSLSESLVRSGHPVGGGPGGRHKASVAMAVWQEQRCILALWAKCHSNLFIGKPSALSSQLVCLSVKPTAVCHSPLPSQHPMPIWSLLHFVKANEVCKDAVSRSNTSWDGSLRSQWPRLNSRKERQWAD